MGGVQGDRPMHEPVVDDEHFSRIRGHGEEAVPPAELEVPKEDVQPPPEGERSVELGSQYEARECATFPRERDCVRQPQHVEHPPLEGMPSACVRDHVDDTVDDAPDARAGDLWAGGVDHRRCGDGLTLQERHQSQGQRRLARAGRPDELDHERRPAFVMCVGPDRDYFTRLHARPPA